MFKLPQAIEPNAQYQRGDLVRLKLNDEVFEVVEILPGGLLRISKPGLQLITSADGVTAAAIL